MSCTTLFALDEETSDCGLCGLAFKRADAGVKTAFGWGNADAKYVLVTGTPMYGLESETEAQRVLKKIWNANGFHEEDWFVTHAIMCPNAYTETAFNHIDACKPRLSQTIDIIDPELIVTSSTMAVYAVLGYDNMRSMMATPMVGNLGVNLNDETNIGLNRFSYENARTHKHIRTANVVDIAAYLVGKETFKESPELVQEEATRLMDSWTNVYNFMVDQNWHS